MTLSYVSQTALRPLPRSGGESIVRAVLQRLGRVLDDGPARHRRAGRGQPAVPGGTGQSLVEQGDGAGAGRVPDAAGRAGRTYRPPGDATKRLLQWAAVIGQEFPAALVGQVVARYGGHWRMNCSAWCGWNSSTSGRMRRGVPVQACPDAGCRVCQFAGAAAGQASHRAVGEALEAQNADRRIDELVELLAHPVW